MATITYNSEHKAVLDRLLSGYPGVRAGKMFGFPAYYAGQKLCTCLYEEGVGIKLPEATAARLLQTDPHVIPFRPLGKAQMREWVQINLPRSEDYKEYISIFEESIQYVLSKQ